MLPLPAKYAVINISPFHQARILKGKEISRVTTHNTNLHSAGQDYSIKIVTLIGGIVNEVKWWI